MAQQNRRPIRKNPAGRVKNLNRKNNIKGKIDKFTEKNESVKSVKKTDNPKKDDIAPVKNMDEHTISAIGQKVKVLNDISTIDGTLYKDEIVKVEATGFAGKDIKVIDTLGRAWYINLTDITTKISDK